MINLRDVSYCRLGTRDLEGAIVFATEILGLEIAERHKEAVYFKSDARTHTLCYSRTSLRPTLCAARRAPRSCAASIRTIHWC